MGRYNLKPSRVYRTATEILKSRLSALSPNHTVPPWYTTIETFPPGEILTRTQPVQHQDVQPRRKIKKQSKMFKPLRIKYEEDSLRQNFFGDHPWELARPRIILEQDGKDGQKCDWSRMEQPGRQLNGESVVQRQLWLLQNVQGMTLSSAYDMARKEFYEIRHQEDVERRVAKEEALSTGAYFGKTMLEVGMGLEDKSYESWKEWAIKEIETIEQQKNAAYTGLDDDEPAPAPGLDGEEEELEIPAVAA